MTGGSLYVRHGSCLPSTDNDGDDAKDLDDAISLRRLKNGNYYLGVHIADVSYYVEEGSELDKEALARATSIVGDKVEAAKLYQTAQDINKITQEIDPRDIADKISELFES